MPQNEPEDSDASICTSGFGRPADGRWERLGEGAGRGEKQTALPRGVRTFTIPITAQVHWLCVDKPCAITYWFF